MPQWTIGIDFGTTTSSMAWVDPRTGEARIIKNAEGEEKTPSVVYFGDGKPLVGTPAEQMLEDENERRRVVVSVKRELVNAPTLALPGRLVKAVDVAAAVLAKLKLDAEELHFYEPVNRAVVTCPAAFDGMERDEIKRAARLAGFDEVELLDEPVAAAFAYSRSGLKVGRHVLVYDLGGGTFDLALLRSVEGSFEIAMEPKGLSRCGGDDFDTALYEYCEEIVLQQTGQRIAGESRDLRFLRECRMRKENLSAYNKAMFSSHLGSGRIFKHTLTRKVLEDLIHEQVDLTVRLTKEVLRSASKQGCDADTVVLIGGSSRVPLIQTRLREAFPIHAHKWQHQDVAVALGAAYFATFERSTPSHVRIIVNDDRKPVLGSEKKLTATVEAKAKSKNSAEHDGIGRFPEPLKVIHDRLAIGGNAPALVIMPAGTYLMGSPPYEPERFPNEGPQHSVTINAFAVGRSAVTFDEYDRFCDATGAKYSFDENWGRGDRPAIHVSWTNAAAYCCWLTEQTGCHYRLPTESEWEYAARASTMTPFWTGTCVNTEQANYNGNRDYGGQAGGWLKSKVSGCGAKTGVFQKQTMPIGSYPGNPWGLFEVMGNVLEWTQDCWHETYLGAPDNGAAFEGNGLGNRISRVVRGGSWMNAPGSLRSAKRFWYPESAADKALGFRVVREIF